MLRSPLIALALFALLGPAAAADDGCEKFAWSLARDRAAFAAPDKTTIAAGETLTALPAGALVIRLQPGAQASFAMPPERKPKTEQWHGGMVRLPALAKPGIYQITLSGRAQERSARSRRQPGRVAIERRIAGCDHHDDRCGGIGFHASSKL
jgi:hypothetical protein